MAMSASLVRMCVLVSLIAAAACSTFLENRFDVADVEASLMSHLDVILGERRARTRVAEMQNSLASSFAVLPKNTLGNMEHSAVRYALSRFFHGRYQWFVNGLDGVWQNQSILSKNTSDSGNFERNLVMSFMYDTVENLLAGHGVNLHVLAMIVVKLESIALDETSNWLLSIYDLFQFSLKSRPIGEKEMGLILDTYLLDFRYERGLSEKTLQEASREVLKFRKWNNAEWLSIQMWARDIWTYTRYTEQDQMNPFDHSGATFPEAARILQAIAKGYGSWLDRNECRVLKGILVELERPGSGRVPLQDYYGHEVAGLVPKPFHFDDKLQYLREQGILDESNPSQSDLIIPNLLLSEGYCHHFWNFHQVCCINECEALIAHLEYHIASTHAEPLEVVRLISNLSSDTVDAPRDVPSHMLQLLDEIGAIHVGKIPLHGRLFAQWMHHAYPNECPYPLLAATNQQMTDTSSLKEGNLSLSEVREHYDIMVKQSNISEHHPINATALLWHFEEELLIPMQPNARTAWSFWVIFRVLVFLPLLGSSGFCFTSGIRSKCFPAARGYMVPSEIHV